MQVVQVHLWVKKPDECDTAKFFDTMISDGIIVDARAEKTMKQNTWFTRKKLHNHDLGKYFLPCSRKSRLRQHDLTCNQPTNKDTKTITIHKTREDTLEHNMINEHPTVMVHGAVSLLWIRCLSTQPRWVPHPNLQMQATFPRKTPYARSRVE